MTATSARVRRRRHLATLASGLGAVLVLGGVALVAATHRPAPETISPGTTRPSAAALTPGGPISLEFPYTLTTSTSNGAVSGNAEAVLQGGVLQLQHSNGVSVQVFPSQPQIAPPKVPTSARTVRGHSGLSQEWVDQTVNRYLLMWPETPGQWIVMQSIHTVSVAGLESLASFLAPSPTKVKMPFTFAEVPANATMDNVERTKVTFCPAGVTPDAGYDHKLAVMLNADWSSTPGDRKVKVGDRNGMIHDGNDARSLAVPLDNGTTLVVQDLTPTPLSDADLVRFSAGIHVTPDAQPAHG